MIEKDLLTFLGYRPKIKNNRKRTNGRNFHYQQVMKEGKLITIKHFKK